MKIENPQVSYWFVPDDSECGDPDISDVIADYAEMLQPLEIEGAAVIERKWAVRFPAATDEDGIITDDDVELFDTKEEADAFVAGLQHEQTA